MIFVAYIDFQLLNKKFYLCVKGPYVLGIKKGCVFKKKKVCAFKKILCVVKFLYVASCIKMDIAIDKAKFGTPSENLTH